MKVEFQDVLQKIPSEENKKVDELAQMASALPNWVEEDTVVRVKLIAKIDQPPTPMSNQGDKTY